ncbi:hypothetical protein BDY19DRAFT_256428 [Irpex rosettiformis]|uniref:Uncharacterized protein n=1 Tax=Irpex rosettiformis TaxID=378272 RepID=A0ACB8UGY1_9APHY|nr:hypothetical protein BDY19DRAFT_256428 [Irpex rosettiformis]
MAQTLAAPRPEPGRISQILPSVKCSTCGKPVPIAELGEHVCSTPPSMPAASAKPPMSPTSPSFFQQKYQNLISGNRPATPKASPTPPPVAYRPPRLSSSSTNPPPRTTSPLSAQRGSLGSASSSSRTPSPGPRVQSPLVPTTSPTTTAPLNVPRASRVSSQYTRAKTPDSSSKIAFPTSAPPGSSEPLPRIPSPLRHHPSEPTRVSTTLSVSSRTSSEPAPFLSHDSTLAPVVARTPSPGANPLSRQQQLQVELGLKGPPPPPPPQEHHQAPAGNVQPLAVRPRAPSSASTRSMRQPVQSSPVPFVPGSGPSTALGSPSHFQQRPRAATDIGNAMPMSPPMNSSSEVIYSTPHRPMPPPGQMRGPPLHLNPHYAPPGTPQPVNPRGPSSPAQDPDTKIGGEAGMAGVGRRGFAAAARAAMFTNYSGPGVGQLSLNSEYPGIDGRRANPPHFLDISSANQYGEYSL